jgi:hypothetical protein
MWKLVYPIEYSLVIKHSLEEESDDECVQEIASELVE